MKPQKVETRMCSTEEDYDKFSLSKMLVHLPQYLEKKIYQVL